LYQFEETLPRETEGVADHSEQNNAEENAADAEGLFTECGSK
jgi:hypothetical protein